MGFFDGDFFPAGFFAAGLLAIGFLPADFLGLAEEAFFAFNFLAMNVSPADLGPQEGRVGPTSIARENRERAAGETFYQIPTLIS